MKHTSGNCGLTYITHLDNKAQFLEIFHEKLYLLGSTSLFEYFLNVILIGDYCQCPPTMCILLVQMG